MVNSGNLCALPGRFDAFDDLPRHCYVPPILNKWLTLIGSSLIAVLVHFSDNYALRPGPSLPGSLAQLNPLWARVRCYEQPQELSGCEPR